MLSGLGVRVWIKQAVPTHPEKCILNIVCKMLNVIFKFYPYALTVLKGSSCEDSIRFLKFWDVSFSDRRAASLCNGHCSEAPINTFYSFNPEG